MQIQLIRNATLRMAYGNRVFITDPYLAPKHSEEPLIGKSRNPVVDLPFPAEDILAGIEMTLVSHLHPDHFDSLAQELLPRHIQIYCQPGDEPQIKEAGFSNVTAVGGSVDWNEVRITRKPGQHGNEVCRAAPRSTVIAIHMETFDFDTVSRNDLRALAEAEGIEDSQLLIPADGEIFAF